MATAAPALPQEQFTDAQLKDGTVLRFKGQLGPDELRQKVTEYRAKQAGPATAVGADKPQGFFARATKAIRDTSSDIRQGTDVTPVGRFLKGLGAPGTESGVSKETSNYMAGAPLGLLRAAQGAMEVAQSGQRMQGAKDIAGGAWQAATSATSPLNFSGPAETASIPGKAAAATAGAVNKVADLGPAARLAKAGAKFQEVMSVAKNHPVEITDDLSKSLTEYQRLVDGGGSRSLAVSKLLNRVTSPEKGPLTYEEARDFGSNLSRLSADEMQRLTPVMRRAVAQISADLRATTEATAARAGKQPQFQEAMKGYRSGMQMRDKLDWLKTEGGKAAIRGGLDAIGLGAGGYFLSKWLRSGAGGAP